MRGILSLACKLLVNGKARFKALLVGITFAVFLMIALTSLFKVVLDHTRALSAGPQAHFEHLRREHRQPDFGGGSASQHMVSVRIMKTLGGGWNASQLPSLAVLRADSASPSPTRELGSG
jgi:hypothetical protein